MAENIVEKKIGKKLLFCSLGCAILLAATSLLQWFAAPDSIDKYYYIAGATAFCLGIAYDLSLRIFFYSISRNHFIRELGFTIVIMLVSLGIALPAYHFLKLHYLFLTHTATFLLPVIIINVISKFKAIPPLRHKPWFHPKDVPDVDTLDLSHIQIIQIVLYKKVSDKIPTSFTLKSSLNMYLGAHLFPIFIKDYNEGNPPNAIEYLNEKQEPYGWLFFRKKGMFKSKDYFDPDLTINENGIKPNEIIYAIRVT